LLGLWYRHFAAGLCWQVPKKDKGAKRTTVKGILSWSWTSIVGGISYAATLISNQADSPNKWIPYIVSRISLESATIEWKSTPITSSIECAELNVRYRLLKVELVTDSPTEGRQRTIINRANKAVVGYATLDEQNLHSDDVQFVEVATQDSYCWYHRVWGFDCNQMWGKLVLCIS
jgi:hypothetical protein